MTDQPIQKDQPPITTVIARGKSGVAIRFFPVPPGPGGALRRRGYGLPHQCAHWFAMTAGDEGWSPFALEE